MIGTYYTDINECPMLAFKLAMSKGDFKAMKRKGLYSKKTAYNAFKKVFNQADDKFKIAESYRQYLSKMVRAMQFYAKAVQGQKHYYTRAKIVENEAKALIGGGNEQEFEVICAMLTKKMCVKVSPKDVTVAEFYSYLEIKA